MTTVNEPLAVATGMLSAGPALYGRNAEQVRARRVGGDEAARAGGRIRWEP
jgi:hypothetical protein